jgi:hypothetical protein
LAWILTPHFPQILFQILGQSLSASFSCLGGGNGILVKLPPKQLHELKDHMSEAYRAPKRCKCRL